MVLSKADERQEREIIHRYDSTHRTAMTRVTEFWAVLRDPRPISINAAYSGIGNRFLTKEGKVFKDALQMAVSQAVIQHEVPWNQVVDLVYKQGGRIEFTIWLYTDLLNGAWRVGGGNTSKGQPRSPYKKMDASNYIKLIEDSVVRGTGIDDSAHHDVSVKKRHAPLDPRIVIHYEAFE